MAAGDAAAAAGLDIYDGNEPANELWIRDNEILDEIAADKTAVRSIVRGGTGASEIAGARANLGIYLGQGDAAPPGYAGQIPVYNPYGQLTSQDPSLGGHVATRQWVMANFGGGGSYVLKSGDVMSGHLFLPGSVPANAGWTVAYINGDGRVSRGASSERYKKFIHDAPELGDLFEPGLKEFKMRSQGEVGASDELWHIGEIAESLVGTPAERFVVVLDGRPESIDFIALGQARDYQLRAELDAARARIDRLEQLVEQLVDAQGDAA